MVSACGILNLEYRIFPPQGRQGYWDKYVSLKRKRGRLRVWLRQEIIESCRNTMLPLTA